MRHLIFGTALSLLVGCGGSGAREPATSGKQSPDEPAAESQPAAESSAASEATGKTESASASEIPSKCARSEGVCTPDRKWVERLCQGSFPSVALILFGKSTPWTRGYLTRKTEAWNAAGGASAAGELQFDEEVIVLVERRENAGGMQVSGSGGGYEALRWDGSCVTLAKEELTLKRPPQPGAAKVEWRWLDPGVRDALSTDELIKTSYQTRRKECKGATSGEVSLKCVKADTKLSEVIVNHVRNGGELGKPEKLP